jgi:hypothetical protein
MYLIITHVAAHAGVLDQVIVRAGFAFHAKVAKTHQHINLNAVVGVEAGGGSVLGGIVRIHKAAR